MKRGTPSHPKVANFAEYLGVRLPYAIGYLELLFHFTAQYCPRGDIGRYSDKRIAAGLMWKGRPEKLVDALLKAGLIDQHPTCRLVVHEWHVHCDDATRRRLERAHESFLSDTGKVTEQSSECSRTALAKPSLASDVLVLNENLNSNGKDKSSTHGSLMSLEVTTRESGPKNDREVWFEAFWKAAWFKTGKGAARAAFLKAATTPAMAQRIIEAAAAQAPILKADAAANGHGMLHPATWLNQQRWDDDIEDLRRNSQIGMAGELFKRSLPSKSEMATRQAADQLRKEGWK